MHVEAVLRTKGTEVVTAAPDSTLLDAAKLLRFHRIGALVVTDEHGGVVGILSERDVVSAVADHGPGALDGPVSGVMTADVVRCAPGDTMEQLMSAMTERRIRHLPVVDGESLVGIVSIGDVVKRRVSEIQDETQALQDYITQGR